MSPTFGGESQHGFLETPRVKRLRLANLRGLLKPDYPHGVRSQIRERMVLEDLSREAESKILTFKALADLMILPFIDASKRAKLVEGAAGILQSSLLLAKLCELQHVDSRQNDAVNDDLTERMAKAFNVLKEAGLGAMMHRALED